MLKHPFWQEKDGNILPLKNEDVATYFANFLPALGFFKIPGKQDNGFVSVQIKGRFVRRIDQNDIREFIVYLMNQHPLGNVVLDQMTLQHQKFFGSNIQTSLRIKSDLKTLRDTRTKAYRFFKNCVV
ncbi:hypothetical protein KQ298_08955, partial [Synechococcus sp. CS-1330]|nr:hypothetical protein [Synechococcus sp. CS-1330]